MKIIEPATTKKAAFIAAVFIIVLFLAYRILTNDCIAFSDPNWRCDLVNEKWECIITLEIMNKSYEDKYRKGIIRAISIPRNPKYSSMKICAEEIFDISINGRDTITIKKKIVSLNRPNKITANVWKK